MTVKIMPLYTNPIHVEYNLSDGAEIWRMKNRKKKIKLNKGKVTRDDF